MNLAVDYEIEVRPKLKTVDFVIKSIAGVPTFVQESEFPIQRVNLAEQLISQTLDLAVGSRVFGSGFRILGG